MKKFFRFIRKSSLLALPFSLLWCNNAFADTFFSVPKNDISLRLLQTIFGPMHGVLQLDQSTQTIFNIVFKSFNQAMLVLAVLVICYTVVMSIINTAHQGEFLGRKFDSLWVPIRSLLGVVLVFPTNVGYSLIQILMMKIVMLGVGAADHVWNAALDAIASKNVQSTVGSVAITTPLPADYTVLANNLLKSALCITQAYQKVNIGKRLDKPLTMQQLEQSLGAVTDGSDKKTVSLSFDCTMPENAGTIQCSPSNSASGATLFDCGGVNWTAWNSDDDFISQTAQSASGSKQVVIPPKLSDIYQAQIPELMNHLLSLAYDVVYNGQPLPPNDKYKLNPIFDPAFKGTPNENGNWAIALSSAVAEYESKDGLNLVLERLASQTGATYDKDNPGQFIKSVATGGWILAGSLFYELANLTSSLNQFGNISDIASYVAGPDTSDIYNHANSQVESWPGNTAGPKFSSSGPSDASGFDILLKPVIMMFEAIITGQTSTSAVIYNNFNTQNINPLIAIQLLGNNIVHTAEVTWMIAMAFLLASSLIAGLCSAASPLGLGFTTTARFIFVPLMFAVGLLFTTGLTMSVYIPLVPFIIFTFAALGWIINVFETILAAPLVALGISHPAGANEVVGIAAPAIMLVVNVFIRPSFMILALLGGMLISLAGVTLLNFTFSLVMNTVGASFGSVQTLFLLTIYVSLVIIIINKSYGIITTSTDDVLRYIGGQGSLGAEKGSGEQEARQSFSGAAASGGKGFERAEGATGQAAKDAHTAEMKPRQEKWDEARHTDNVNKGLTPGGNVKSTEGGGGESKSPAGGGGKGGGAPSVGSGPKNDES